MNSSQGTCDWQTSRKEIKERGQYVLEAGIWSDCSFVVGTEPHQQVFNGHKLILAMSSPVFEAMFYGGMAEKEPPIAILDVQPDAFRALLEYIYTDRINLTSFDQACELCYGAKKYMLPHLVEECTKFLWSDLYPKNACRAYEFAKLFEEPVLMEKCLHIISTQTREVLAATSFEDIDLSTMLTLFDLNELNIYSELELFTALSRYANANCNNPTLGSKVPRLDEPVASPSNEANGLHSTLHDTLMKIRFLTLTPQEFAEGPATSNLLTESEKFAILMNISSPTTTVAMPAGFSTSRVHRLFVRSTRQVGSTVADTRSSLVSFHNSESGSASFLEEGGKKLYCTRDPLRLTDYCNTNVLDCSVTFTCDRNVCIYGIQVPTQTLMENDGQHSIMLNASYIELLHAHLLDADGSRLTYTHFTSRVPFRTLIDICFNRPFFIQRNKAYKVGVVLHKAGHYPIGTYPPQSVCNGVVFSFSQGQSGESGRDCLIRSIIFSNTSSGNSHTLYTVPGSQSELNKFS